jgi:hypothetical protein
LCVFVATANPSSSTASDEKQHLGYFDDEWEAAQAVDTAARRLRGEELDGGRLNRANMCEGG